MKIHLQDDFYADVGYLTIPEGFRQQEIVLFVLFSRGLAGRAGNPQPKPTLATSTEKRGRTSPQTAPK